MKHVTLRRQITLLPVLRATNLCHLTGRRHCRRLFRCNRSQLRLQAEECHSDIIPVGSFLEVVGSLDHGVTVVAFEENEDGIKYWLVKNSWGANWSEGGYMRLRKDVGFPKDLCGIAMYASYPVV
ncbi:unnamed protein product [Prunus armeniaca]